MRRTQRTTKDELREACAKKKIYVRTYSPGDGVTRYRFFKHAKNSYFGPENGQYTALGMKEAVTYARGRGVDI